MGWIGCVHWENINRDFVAQACALVAPVQPILHRLLCSNETTGNTPKLEFGVQWGGSGAVVEKNSDVNLLHELVHQWLEFTKFCTEVCAALKQSETSQNMSFGSNWVDLVRSL
jgi:hypothetical protein